MRAEAFFRHPLGMTVSAIVATFLWGSAFPVIKLSYQSLDIGPNEIGEQILFAGYRFILSGLFIFLFFMLLGKKKEMKFQKSSVPVILKIGLLVTFLQYFFFYIGLSTATGIQGSIIAGTSSFFQIIFAHFLLKNDQLTPMKALGLMIGFGGVLVTYMPKGDLAFTVGYGEIMVLISTIVAAYGNIVLKRALSTYTPHYLTGYGMIFGSSLLFVLGMVLTDFTFFQFTMIDVLMLVYLAFLSACGFLIWNNIMKYHPVGKVSIFNFLIPVFGVMLSGLFLDEKVGISIIIGLGLVAVGIITVNSVKRIDTAQKATSN